MIQHNMQTLKVRKTSFCHFSFSETISRNSLNPNHRLPARNITRWKNEIFRADSVKCHAHRADKS